MFERNENDIQLNYLRKLILSPYKSNERIQSLALTPNEQTLLIKTNENHFYQFSFHTDYQKEENDLFINMIDSSHYGLIKKRCSFDLETSSIYDWN